MAENEFKLSMASFKGATSNKDGKSGKVPQPLISDINKFLKSDGSWSYIPSTIFRKNGYKLQYKLDYESDSSYVDVEGLPMFIAIKECPNQIGYSDLDSLNNYIKDNIADLSDNQVFIFYYNILFEDATTKQYMKVGLKLSSATNGFLDLLPTQCQHAYDSDRLGGHDATEYPRLSSNNEFTGHNAFTEIDLTGTNGSTNNNNVTYNGLNTFNSNVIFKNNIQGDNDSNLPFDGNINFIDEYYVYWDSKNTWLKGSNDGSFEIGNANGLTLYKTSSATSSNIVAKGTIVPSASSNEIYTLPSVGGTLLTENSVDSQLNNTSTNPIQNKVVNAAISSCNSSISGCNSAISACNTSISACNTRIDNCNTEIDTCNTRIDTCNTNIAGCLTKLGNYTEINSGGTIRSDAKKYFVVIAYKTGASGTNSYEGYISVGYMYIGSILNKTTGYAASPIFMIRQPSGSSNYLNLYAQVIAKVTDYGTNTNDIRVPRDFTLTLYTGATMNSMSAIEGNNVYKIYYWILEN